ncbi:MAG: Lrp/AsnC family leucine-responsive transcriptional regulator [Paracrocinitomix sp.]|jgi:Lrp/AsnC family leucine-responsive transcriptional regulator
MDAIDRKILAILQEDGRITVTELAKQVQLSVSATGERLRQLQTSGVIRRFAAIVDPAEVGRPIETLVDVRVGSNETKPWPELDQIIASFPAVIDAVHLTGRFDTQLRVATKDVAELDELLTRIKDELGAEETNTRLVLRTVDSFPRSPL